MLKFFFGRDSWVVRLLNILCAGWILYNLWRSQEGLLDSQWGFWGSYFAFSWLFFNVIHWIPWYHSYKRSKGKLGIRLHFQKNIVPLAYGTAFVFALRFLGVRWAWLWPLGLLWLPIYYVTFILLYFHFKDQSELMPGYFSHNFYREDENS